MAKMPKPRSNKGMLQCTCGKNFSDLVALTDHWHKECKNNPDSEHNKGKK